MKRSKRSTGPSSVGVPSMSVADLGRLQHQLHRRDVAMHSDWEDLLHASRAEMGGRTAIGTNASDPSLTRMLHRARHIHPTVDHRHKTAIELNRGLRTTEPGTAADSEGTRAFTTEPPPLVACAGARASGTASVAVAKVRAGFGNVYHDSHAQGGRLSSVSIPSAKLTKIQLQTMRRAATAPTGEFAMLPPETFHKMTAAGEMQMALEHQTYEQSWQWEQQPPTRPSSTSRQSPGGRAHTPQVPALRKPGVHSVRSLDEGRPTTAPVPSRPAWNRLSHSVSVYGLWETIQTGHVAARHAAGLAALTLATAAMLWRREAARCMHGYPISALPAPSAESCAMHAWLPHLGALPAPSAESFTMHAWLPHLPTLGLFRRRSARV